MAAQALMVTTVKTEQTEQQDSQELMDQWGLPETQDQSDHRDQKGMLELRGLQENLELVPMALMVFQAQMGSQVNLGKLDLLV